MFPQEMEDLGLNQGPQSFIEFVQKTMRGIIVLQGRDLRFSDDAFYDVSVSGIFQDEDKQTNRSHAHMATVCLNYLLGLDGQEMLRSLSVEHHGLKDKDLNWSPLMLPRHTLGSYALRFWTFHYNEAGNYRPAELAWELFQDEQKRRVWAEAVYVISNPFNRIQREYISPLPYMAMYGLDDLIRRHIQNEGEYNGLNQDHWLAIVEAARNEHRKTVVLLLKHADTNPAGLEEAVNWAASSDYPDAAAAALDVLISEAQRFEYFCCPPFILGRAAASDHSELLSYLVQAGYDPNERDPTCFFTNAVHTAIMLDRPIALDVLLKGGRVDLTLKAKYHSSCYEASEGFSPLAGAVSCGNRYISSMLEAAGADFSDYGAMQGSFMDAVHWGSHDTLAWLLEPASKPYQEYLGYGLIGAAYNGFPQCVRLLLDDGADPNLVEPTRERNALADAIGGFEGARFEVCRMLLEAGADPNELKADYLGQFGPLSMCRGPTTLLMLAIALDNAPLVSLLLDYGAKINGVDPDAGADLPLTVAVLSGSIEIVNLLLERGADPNLGCGSEHPGAVPPISAACQFEPQMEIVETLIKYGAKVQGTVALQGSSLMHVVAGSQDRSLHLLPLLLSHGAEINATSEFNLTPLHWASAAGSTKFVELLLKQTDPKPDLEIVSVMDGYTGGPARTALHRALREGHPEIAKLLLEAGANINCQDIRGRFPLGQLLASDKPELQSVCEDMVEFMLKWRPNLGLSDEWDNTVLHNITSDTPLSAVVRLVVEGAPVNTFNERGYNPLACAVQCGNINAARYLTTVRGVQTDVHHPSFGSILHLAAAHSTLDVVRQLVRTGAEHTAVNPTFGESVLYSTVGNENKKELRKIIRYLVEEVGVDVDAPGGRWVCALLRTVVESKGIHLLKYLLNYGARTDHVDFLGRTAVHWAVINQRQIYLQTLVDFGADILVVDKFGRSPLHFAASKGDLNILRHLLAMLPDGAANEDAVDVDGWTPLMWAARSGSSMAFALIDECQADTCARSHDAQWSPLRIARLCGWDEGDIEGLKQRIEDQGREGSCLPQDDETEPGERYEQICVGCDMVCALNPARRLLRKALLTSKLDRRVLVRSGLAQTARHTFASNVLSTGQKCMIRITLSVKWSCNLKKRRSSVRILMKWNMKVGARPEVLMRSKKTLRARPTPRVRPIVKRRMTMIVTRSNQIEWPRFSPRAGKSKCGVFMLGREKTLNTVLQTFRP